MARRKNSRSTAAEGSLAPTALHQKLATLQEERQWLLRQIRRKRTELDNFMEQMRELVTELFQQGVDLFKQFQDLDTEIHTLFEELLTKRKMGKKSRQQVEALYQSLQLQGTISFRSRGKESGDDDFFANFAEDFGDFPDGMFGADTPGDSQGKAESSDPDAGASGAPRQDVTSESASPPQDRTFRQTFLRLAAIYHPDRAENEDAQRQNTEVMKAINQAYKSGDFARLLELEQQQQQGDLTAGTVEVGDDLEQQCQRLAKENNSLREQYEGIKAELRTLRNNTQEGMMVKTYRKATKEGIDFIDELLGETEAVLEHLEMIRNFVRDFRDRKITLKTFLAGPGPDSEDELLIMLEQMLGVSVQGPF